MRGSIILAGVVVALAICVWEAECKSLDSLPKLQEYGMKIKLKQEELGGEESPAAADGAALTDTNRSFPSRVYRRILETPKPKCRANERRAANGRCHPLRVVEDDTESIIIS